MQKEARFPVFKERLYELMGNQYATEFAEKLGLTRQTVGFYLNGDRIPDAITLRQICDRCQVSADYLIGLSKEQKRDPDRQAVYEYLGLHQNAITNVRSLPLSEKQVLNAILSQDKFLDVMEWANKACGLFEYSEVNEAAIQNEREEADGETIAAIEYLHNHYFESMEFDEAAELYIEKAKSIFGELLKNVVFGK